METFSVEAQQEGLVGVLRTDGYINNSGADRIVHVCSELQDQGVASFLLNLEKSRLINSIGIAILIEMIENVVEREGKVGFCSVTPTIEKTFKIMGLLKRSTVYGTEEEGLAALNA